MVLLTGATGYVGGCLLAELERRQVPVRALTRSPENRAARSTDTEVVRGDVTDSDSLAAAFDGVRAAYYLVHSLGGNGSFGDEERRGAETFATAARKAGLERIVYLGGLGRGDKLSPHLESRQEVGRILRESGVPAIELRASIVIGDGSVSFDALRSLVELPIGLLPSWVNTASQPIAIDDVVAYLVEALDVPLRSSELVEIGGADQVAYVTIMEEIARQTGRTRFYLTVPTPMLPIPELPIEAFAPERLRILRKLIESLPFETTVQSARASELFASVSPRGLTDAVAAALA